VKIVLDAEAVNALLQPHHPGRATVRRVMRAAFRLRREIVVPTVTLAELYRGAGRSRALDAMLARESDNIVVRDTDRRMARLVGGILAEAGVGSEFIVDAHAIAAAVEDGGGIVLTGDVDDLSRLAAPYRNIVVEPLS
jgi:predicted nucleic acid-binding protein